MITTIVEAAKIQLRKNSTDPLAEPVPKKHVLIVGGYAINEFADILKDYSVSISSLIPTQTPHVDQEYELEKAARFEESFSELCRGTGIARDLSGFDTDSVDLLIITSLNAEIRDAFISGAWRVVPDLGKVVIFSSVPLPISYLTEFGIAAPIHYASEGFYIGTMRKASAVRAQN